MPPKLPDNVDTLRSRLNMGTDSTTRPSKTPPPSPNPPKIPPRLKNIRAHLRQKSKGARSAKNVRMHVRHKNVRTHVPCVLLTRHRNSLKISKKCTDARSVRPFDPPPKSPENQRNAASSLSPTPPAPKAPRKSNTAQAASARTIIPQRKSKNTAAKNP